ncbi:nuclear transport factor 2 family protein [Sphingobium tyrosinilyticum]|uniref:Nuclear transport factor 2 family protein n=1 Tax=Sphingobium tyrosinilyticum TaxID=2715436 RepID=A0ABV9F1V5_9SPHN
MTSNVNRDLFVTMLTALGRKEFDTVERCLADDIVFEWPFPVMDGFPTEHRGAGWFLQAMETSWRDFDDYAYKIEVIHDLAEDTRLIAEYSSHSRYRPTGEPYSNRYISILDFADGRITRWREYVNPRVVAQVLGERASWSEDNGAHTAPA